MRNGLLLGVLLVAACGLEEAEQEGADVASVEQQVQDTSALYMNAIYMNAIYMNAIYMNAIYMNGTFENGYAIEEGSNGWLKPWARVAVGPVANGFSMAFTQEWGPYLSTSNWAANPTRVRYVEGETSGCAHPTTQTGARLASGCNQLVTLVCVEDPYCCATGWDARCVGEAVATSSDYNSTFHSVLTTGGGLLDNVSGCAALVNAERSSCRTSWDATCVETVYHACYARYVTRPRVEEGRFMADACVEPRGGGTPACLVPGSGPTQKECCRRSLVLNGVYTHIEPPEGSNVQKIQWSNWSWAQSTVGTWTQVKVTMVPDPDTGPVLFGFRMSGPTHHLWQLAGPGQRVYPDAPNVPNDVTWANDPTPVDTGHRLVTYRPILLEMLAALTNTQVGVHHLIDLRYTWFNPSDPILDKFDDVADNGILPPYPDYSVYPTELVMGWSSVFDGNATPARRTYTAYPACKGSMMKRTMTGLDPCPQPYTTNDWTIRSIWGNE